MPVVTIQGDLTVWNGTVSYTAAQFYASTATTNFNMPLITTAAANTYVLDWAVVPTNPAAWRREKLQILRASKRARKTLMKFLNAEQLATYAATGRFKVAASNGWVFELGKRRNALLLGDDGRADASFCIHPKERFPDEDTILSLMLLLMSDVQEFLKIANRTTIRQRQLEPLRPPPLAVPSFVELAA